MQKVLVCAQFWRVLPAAVEKENFESIPYKYWGSEVEAGMNSKENVLSE